MSGSYHRDVGPVIQVFRAVLRGRGWNEQLRRPENLAPRPYPKPQLPGGPSHKTSLNYYLGRDARRMVEPPLAVADTTTKHLTSGPTDPKSGSKKSSAPKPGDTYLWDKLD